MAFADYAIFSILLGWVTVIVELGGLLIICGGKLRSIIALICFGTQLGIWFLMGVAFPLCLASYLFFVPWHDVGRAMGMWP